MLLMQQQEYIKTHVKNVLQLSATFSSWDTDQELTWEKSDN